MNDCILCTVIYGILLIVGGICLLITVSVSLYLPDLRRRIHNKIALSHNSSLMIAYFAWGCTQLSVDLGDTTCIILSEYPSIWQIKARQGKVDEYLRLSKIENYD